jgi:putative Holliday junction resolvase
MRVLGVDLGLRRVGLAVSDASGTLARPLRTIQAGASPAETARRIAAEALRLGAEPDGLGMIVVGLPCRLDGSPTDQTAIASTIAAELGGLTGLAVALQDERLTSHEAESRLAQGERDWRRRKPRLDAAAAAIILQDYLDERCSRP